MNVDLTQAIFHDEEAARAHFETVRWPNGPFCPHCGSVNFVRMAGDKHRAGLLNCRDCDKQYSATVGTVFEASHLPLHKWLLVNHLMNASKKGVSAKQVERMLGITYKSAWFMCHRIRAAMTDPNPAPVGGTGKVVEADEAYHGKRETPRSPSAQRGDRPYVHRGREGGQQKRPILALVERGGQVRTKHVNHVNGANVRDFVVRNADRKSRLHTDESRLYPSVGSEFAKHETVNHGDHEYARDDVTTNTIEGFFGVFKRGMVGVYQHCGEQHFQRYLDEFAFRYNNRS